MGLFVISWCPICYKYELFGYVTCKEHPDVKRESGGILDNWKLVEEIKEKRQQYLREQKLKRICNDSIL